MLWRGYFFSVSPDVFVCVLFSVPVSEALSEVVFLLFFFAFFFEELALLSEPAVPLVPVGVIP